MRYVKELKNINHYLMYSLQASFSRKKSVPLQPIFIVHIKSNFI